METSPKGILTKTDWKKILKGFCIAIGGAILAYLSQEVIPSLQSMDLQGNQLLLVSISSTVVNILHKLFTESQYNS